MMLKQFTHCRQFLLIALMTFMLGTVQLVQVSALHDHSQHTVDCALCHLPLSDDPGAQSIPKPDLVAQGTFRFFLSATAAHSANPSPYQGRAPPRVFL